MGGECTKSGQRLWMLMNVFFGFLLLIDLAVLRNTWVIEPNLGSKIGLIGSLAFFGTIAGLVLLHNGLTNDNFNMNMRVGLVSSGALVSTGALVGSLFLSMPFL
jgi:hypothetical protein